MAMGLAVSNRVTARNDIGRFIKECEMAAKRTIERAVEEGAQMSRDFAPVGHKVDERTVPLAQSIKSRMLSRTSGEWYATARHALPIEFGAAPHEIYGSPGLKFYWESAGRMFVPAEIYYNQPGLVTVVNHPGNAPQPYLRPAYKAIMDRIMAIARAEYPG